MLSINTGASRFCDGVTRRSFLKAGALAVGGLSLPTRTLPRYELKARRVVRRETPGG